MRSTGSTHVYIGVAAAIAFATAAALRYPGGTFLEASSSGYSLTHNFLSDLGMTVAYDERPNMLGAIAFALSLLVLVTLFGRAGLGFVRQYRAVAAARAWAVAAAVLMPVVCIAFAAVAVTPENRVMGLHVDATLLAWRVFAVAALLFTVASVRADTQARGRTVAWGALTIALACYVLYLAVGPSVATADGLRAQVIAQKIMAACAVSLFTYLSVALHPARH